MRLKKKSDYYYRFGFFFIYIYFFLSFGMFWISGRGNDGDPSFSIFFFTETMTEHQRIFGRKTRGSKEKMPNWGRWNWVDFWGSGVGESLCATSRREQKKLKKQNYDDDDGRFVGGTIDSVRSQINGADLVVKIVQGPFVVCRIVPQNTKWNCSVKRKRNLFRTISFMSLVMYIYIGCMISYDGCVMMSSDIPTASHPITIFRGVVFPSHHVRFLEIDSYIRYWRPGRANNGVLVFSLICQTIGSCETCEKKEPRHFGEKKKKQKRKCEIF